MTIEIRELVIQAKVVTSNMEKSIIPVRSIAKEKVDEARMIEMVTKRVIDKLREEEGWMR
ncbi:hypothetical protein SAMN05660489_04877 [Pseudomonas sp. LAMO17WK12:I10]|uniref:DUF5908 family protein n=1 Tax=unclassified Pseudomonas TaxID=196821 RepID=UPI000BD862AD|nr:MULTISPECIES: DUF5908 family protein [unclassified Pseudomonas]PXX59071.1 hypothetical protein H160_04800 [Pseudomonas sp. LAMO17WK12:I9]SNY48410.1 hypothetical protein SAMN05660489_04877 [Pseudomonas sp. LAMO17WK12:I10]